MIIKNSTKNDYKEIRNLWDKCFQEDSVDWRNWYFENIYSVENVVIAKKEDELISMVHMNPYSIFMRGVQIDAFALSGVATRTKYRGQGHAGELIKVALNKAHEIGYDFSFLYPFKYSYYEKFGYKTAYNKYKYEGRYKAGSDSNLVVCDMFSTEDFKRVYNKFTSNKNGYVIRDAEYYRIHIKELLCDNRIICFSIDKKYGYFAIDIEETVIEELVYEGELSEAVIEIVNHFKKEIVFKNLYESDNLQNIREPHCMARVISVQGVFNKIICKDADIKIEITDDIVKDNNGVFHIVLKDGKSEIVKTQSDADYSIDISMLAPILLGLETDDNDAQEIQSILFDKSTPFIYEVC